MAKKAKGNKRINASKLATAKLPAGFTAVAVGGGFGAWHDFHSEPVLQGRVVGTDSYEAEDDDGKKKTRRILRVEVSKGVTHNVGESAALKELFDTKGIKGKQVFVQFLGQDSFKKGRQTRKINKFAVGVK